MGNLRKQFKAPWFTRNIEITVNVPEVAQSTPAPAPQPSKPSGWPRVWAVAKVAGPALTAITALAISVLTLVEQHQQSAAAAAASRRQAAELVTYVQQDPTTVLVENLGTAPAFFPTFSVQVFGVAEDPRTKKGYPVATNQSFSLDDIPACSSATVNFGPAIFKSIITEKPTPLVTLAPLTISDFESSPLTILVESETFTDGNGLTWKYSIGNLEEVGLSPSTLSDNYIPVTFKPANGCI